MWTISSLKSIMLPLSQIKIRVGNRKISGLLCWLDWALGHFYLKTSLILFQLPSMKKDHDLIDDKTDDQEEDDDDDNAKECMILDGINLGLQKCICSLLKKLHSHCISDGKIGLSDSSNSLIFGLTNQANHKANLIQFVICPIHCFGP